MILEVRMMKNNDIIQHYASPYYDPDYFKRYYQEHRDEILAKKRKGTKKSDAELESALVKRGTRAAINKGISNAQKTDTTKLRDEHKAKANAYRDQIKNRLTKISDKLKDDIKKFNESYNKKAEADTARTSVEKKRLAKKAEDANTKATRSAERQIESLRKQMKNTKSPSQKIALQRQINRASNELAESKKATALAKATSSAAASNDLKGRKLNYNKIKSANSEQQRESAKNTKEAVREERKKTLDTWRKNLNSQIEAIRGNYKSIRKTEMQKFDESYQTSSPSSNDSLQEKIKQASARARKQSEERRQRNKRFQK